MLSKLIFGNNTTHRQELVQVFPGEKIPSKCARSSRLSMLRPEQYIISVPTNCLIIHFYHESVMETVVKIDLYILHDRFCPFCELFLCLNHGRRLSQTQQVIREHSSLQPARRKWEKRGPSLFWFLSLHSWVANYHLDTEVSLSY